MLAIMVDRFSGLTMSIPSFHGIAKQGSYPIGVCRLDTAGRKRGSVLALALSEGPDIPVEIRRAIGFDPFQSSGKPSPAAGTDRRKLPLDGDLGEVVHGDSERLRGPFKVTERLV